MEHTLVKEIKTVAGCPFERIDLSVFEVSDNILPCLFIVL